MTRNSTTMASTIKSNTNLCKHDNGNPEKQTVLHIQTYTQEILESYRVSGMVLPSGYKVPRVSDKNFKNMPIPG